jgi:hypothetical protein
LLHELKTDEEAGAGADTEAASSVPADPTVLICERCHHHHTRLQNFCGMCGAPLLPGMATQELPRITEVPDRAPVESVMTDADRADPFFDSEPIERQPIDRERTVPETTQELNLEGLLTPGLLFDPNQRVPDRREPMRDAPRTQTQWATTQSMIYADDPPPAIAETLPSFRERAPERRVVESPAEIDWLRERHFAQEIGGESSGAWKVVVVLGALLLVGALVYFRVEILGPLRSAISPTSTQKSTSQAGSISRTTPPEPIPEESAATPAEHPAQAGESADRQNEPAKIAKEARTPAVSQSAAPRAGKIQNAAQSPPPPPATAEPGTDEVEGGVAELALAEKLLSGTTGARNSAAAASLLWKAVGKENKTAILLLSDLYAAGDGVPKSCDQARLLLDAALRKGTPGAANRLQNLQRSCR